MRPPGYEPGELPTAPLRDVIISLSDLRLQSYSYYFECANIMAFFLSQSQILIRNHYAQNKLLCN